MMGETSAKLTRRWIIAVSEDEAVWRSWAVSLVIFMCVAIGVSIIWIAYAPDEASMLRRVSILSPFGAIYIAAVTFCTVVWRGLISARQADQQFEQVEGLKRQIATAETEQQASLLLRGAELLDKELPNQQSVGLALLDGLARGNDARFSTVAIGTIQTFLTGRSTVTSGDPSPVLRAARLLNALGKDRGRNYVAEFTLEGGNSIQPFFFLSAVRYVNARFRNCDFTWIGGTTFQDCKFFNCCVGLKMIIKKGGFFANCRILALEASADITARLSFNSCDFSGCAFIGPGSEKIVLSSCYYYEDNPPSQTVLDVFGEQLTAIEDGSPAGDGMNRLFEEH